MPYKTNGCHFMKRIFLSITLLTMLSCNKSTIVPNQPNSFKKESVPNLLRNGRSPGNAANPFDYVGQLHNDGLDFIKDFADNNLEFSPEDIVDNSDGILVEFLLENELEAQGLDMEDAKQYVDEELYETEIEIVDSNSYFLALMVEKMDSLDFYSTFSDYKNAMILVEAQISASTVSEKDLLLKTASVGRWSADYWWDISSSKIKPTKADALGLQMTNNVEYAIFASEYHAVKNFFTWLYS